MQDEAAKVVVEIVVNLLFRTAKREIDYAFNCIENVDILKSELDKLKKFKEDVQQRIDIAKSKGEKLLYGVQEWVDKNDLISKAEEFLAKGIDDANKSCNCQNYGTLHQFGKRATKISRSLQRHYDDGKGYESCCSITSSEPGILEYFDRKNHDDIDTQNSILHEIIKAIKDEETQIMEIYGTGGIGKTTLAVEAAARVQNLFDDVVFITVSKTIDDENRNKVQVAAKRIKNKEKLLIILDDVWEELKLHNLGIPWGKNHMNYKILSTSRKQNVCSGMKARKTFCVDFLPEKEAWILFKRVVGEIVENDARLEVAKEVAKECGGMPLIIEVVGNALKDKEEYIWRAALNQLKNHAIVGIGSEISRALNHLRLSYDYLENDKFNEAKSFFLLCSMFPEDASISLERLSLYGVGLGKFADLNSIEDARNRVRIAVNTLKSSSLLVNGSSPFSAKMHDIVRKVALLIASENEGKNKFLVKAGNGLPKWQPNHDNMETYTGISLMQNNICKLPNRKLHVPLLDILLTQDNPKLSNISDEFIQSLEKTKVLDMENNNISFLPSSMRLLKTLRMLNLGGNSSLLEISIIGDLEALEILILNDTGIERIPKEIGQLENLRMLEVRGCRKLSHIEKGVISNLSSLEELNIGFYVVQVGTYNSLVELSELSSLTTLKLFVHVFDLIPEGVQFETLKKYVIQIGGNETSFNIPKDFDSGHRLILEIPNLPQSITLKKLIEASDYIYLKSIANVTNILPDVHFKGFYEIKCVELIQCENVSCLVSSTDSAEMQTLFSSNDLGGLKTTEKLCSKMENVFLRDMSRLEVLWNCPHQYISFCKLETIFLSLCPKLARLFPVKVAQGLVNLKSIALSCCECLEVVIWAQDEETSNSEIEIHVNDAEIEFPRLTTIYLDQLPRLKSFYSGNSTIKYPSLRMITMSKCSSLTTWGLGVHDIPKIKFHYQGAPSNINEIMATCSEKNETMRFDSIDNE